MSETHIPCGEICRKRKALHWSIRKLAQQAGVSQPAISRAENGRTKSHRTTLRKIEAALGRREFHLANN